MSELINQLNFQCLYFRGESYDKPTIEDAIGHLAGYLRKNCRSLSPFVHFSAHNHIKTIIAYYAILKAGKIAVIIDPQNKTLENEEIFRETCPAAVINVDIKNLRFDYSSEIRFFKDERLFDIKSDLNGVCTLAYTNAVDGYSKAAMLTEKNFYMEAMGLKAATYLTQDSVICGLLPYSHLYGFSHGIITPTLAGGKGLVTEVNLLKMDETVGQITETGVTHLYTVPSIYYIMGKMPDTGESLKHVKRFYSGGIQLSRQIYDSFLKKTGKKIGEGYGLTESSPAVAGPYDNPVFGSFGKAFPGCEIKIVNDEKKECLPEEVGEISIKGAMVFKGYFNNPEATRAVLRDEWLFTGDLGKKDQDGNIYFCGLKKDMINIAGNKLYPKKLVRLFKMHNNVESVEIGYQTSILQGSTPTCTIQLKKNSSGLQDEFKHWCYANINNSILPKTWNFE